MEWRLDDSSPRKTAESTGKFPPTPTLHNAARTVRVIKLLDPPAAVANTAVMKSVMLKDNLFVDVRT